MFKIKMQSLCNENRDIRMYIIKTSEYVSTPYDKNMKCPLIEL